MPARARARSLPVAATWLLFVGEGPLDAHASRSSGALLHRGRQRGVDRGAHRGDALRVADPELFTRVRPGGLVGVGVAVTEVREERDDVVPPGAAGDPPHDAGVAPEVVGQ